MKYTIYIVFILCCACANVVAPKGGIKDIESPKVIRTTPINNTNQFEEEEIIIEFDELIQFNDEQNIFISPYEKDGAKASISKNKLKIQFNTSLKKNTTYKISLDNVVKDVNEGNVLKDLNYLFSTGQNIDTLSISGKAKDAFSDTPLENVWIILYNKEMDSALYKETPIYIVKSTDLGDFAFPNLPNHTYSMYAIQDLDNNLRFSIPNEKVGFYPVKVVSQTKDIEILLFDETAMSDTITTQVSDSLSDKFGNLIIDSLPKNGSLIIELLQDKNVVHRSKASFPTLIDSLLPGNYSLRVIEDKNENGVWDSGNLNNKIQAEKVKMYPKAINIREDWDIIIDWETN